MSEKKVSASQLSKLVKMPTKEVFKCLLENELVTQDGEGWKLTDLGAQHGGELVQSKRFGDYLVWPPNLLEETVDTSEYLSSTTLGKEFNTSANLTNKILAELAWIEKGVKGWKITKLGIQKGGEEREHHQSGVPFVKWPKSVLENKELKNAFESLSATSKGNSNDKDNGVDDFRKKYEAAYRATDGHYVRSRAEMLIDNWLYTSRLVHAYERKLPVEEEVYSDFYLPDGKVYIEFWGMESDAKYAKRKEEKLKIYEKYGFNLIELTDSDLMNLDDVLPRTLLKFGISTD